jgi:hypothetical protein
MAALCLLRMVRGLRLDARGTLRRTFLVASALALDPGCYGGGVYGPLGATCPALSAPDPLSVRYSANAVADGKVKTFVAAAKDLVGVSLQMEREASDACARMAYDLGVSPAELTPRSPDQPGAAAQAACAAVAARMDAALSQGIRVQVSVTPPVCQADARAKARCDGVCAAQVDPGLIVAQCEPARLSGYCNGTCQGQCDANCHGQCQGICVVPGANGQCAGRCLGTCSGSCDGVCHAHCQGTWQAPECQGYLRPPSADAECNASCNAQADFRASCTPALVFVRFSQMDDLAARLALTLQANLPELLHAEIALGRRLEGSVRAVMSVGSALPQVVGNAGAEALACIAAASSASVQASTRIDVTLRASAGVTGRIGAS